MLSIKFNFILISTSPHIYLTLSYTLLTISSLSPTPPHCIIPLHTISYPCHTISSPSPISSSPSPHQLLTISSPSPHHLLTLPHPLLNISSHYPHTLLTPSSPSPHYSTSPHLPLFRIHPRQDTRCLGKKSAELSVSGILDYYWLSIDRGHFHRRNRRSGLYGRKQINSFFCHVIVA